MRSAKPPIPPAISKANRTQCKCLLATMRLNQSCCGMIPVAPSQFHRSLILGFPRTFELGSGIQQQLYHIISVRPCSAAPSRPFFPAFLLPRHLHPRPCRAESERCQCILLLQRTEVRLPRIRALAARPHLHRRPVVAG